MDWKQVMKRIANWTIPPNIQKVILSNLRRMRMLDPELRSILARNKVFQNCHSGERCFILGTGPSINKQDLTLLRGEVCISLNTFYIHKDYHLINPRYHLISGLALHPLIPHEVGLQWFREMEERITDAIIFLNYFDREFVLKHGLFKDRKVHYLFFGANWDDLLVKGIDATKALYPAQSVSVIAIQLALYMGFKEIYLLGLDHDWILRFVKRLPTHFYKPEDSILEKSGLTDWDKTDWEEQFWCNWNLWRQYKKLKAFAQSKDIAIYNATAGGLLDVFERVDYNSLFK
jgi:hypothetical protein